MPTIRVMIPRGAWTKEEKAVIVEKVTDGLNAAAEQTGKGEIKSFINVQIEEAAEGGYAVGGQVLA